MAVLEKILIHAPAGLPPKLVSGYVTNCCKATAAAKAAMNRSDYEQTSILGHRLKGTGGAYGIPVLTEIGSLIEEASLRGDTSEVQRQVARLEEYLGRIEIISDEHSSS